MFLEENIVFVVATVFILGIACFWSVMCYLIAVAYYRHYYSQNRNMFEEDGKETSDNELIDTVSYEYLDYPSNRPNEGHRVNKFNSI